MSLIQVLRKKAEALDIPREFTRDASKQELVVLIFEYYECKGK